MNINKKIDTDIMFDVDWHGGGVFLNDLINHLISRYVSECFDTGIQFDKWHEFIENRVRKNKKLGILVHGHKFDVRTVGVSALLGRHPSLKPLKSGMFARTYVYRILPKNFKEKKS